MEIHNFTLFAILAAVFYIAGSITISLKKKAGIWLFIAGIAVQLIYIIILWNHLERPPMRTLGETRLWYSFFMPIIGLATWWRWRYSWFLIYCTAMSLLFTLLNLLFSENLDKTLMPALQSPWFIPHVLVYVFAYALLAASTIVAIKALIERFIFESLNHGREKQLLLIADNIVYIGFAFLTMGLLFGALWAKEAWGHYWTWDPKETWAFITWLGYLIYIHIRINRPQNTLLPLWILALAFVLLLIAWFGVNYLPSAQNSVHVYG